MLCQSYFDWLKAYSETNTRKMITITASMIAGAAELRWGFGITGVGGVISGVGCEVEDESTGAGTCGVVSGFVVGVGAAPDGVGAVAGDVVLAALSGFGDEGVSIAGVVDAALSGVEAAVAAGAVSSFAVSSVSPGAGVFGLSSSIDVSPTYNLFHLQKK